MTQNACNCKTCKPFIKEGETVNKWDETGEFHICGKCGKSYSPYQSLDAEFKLMNMSKKPFIVANVREIIDGWEHFDPEGYTFSRMVEMLNEVAEKFYVGTLRDSYKPMPKDSGTGFTTYKPGDEKYYKQC